MTADTRIENRKGALAGLSLAILMASLGTSIANVALPTLTRAFDAPFQQAQWVVLAYLLATTTVLVGAGRLGDRLGRRRLLLAGIALFTDGVGALRRRAHPVGADRRAGGAGPGRGAHAGAGDGAGRREPPRRADRERHGPVGHDVGDRDRAGPSLGGLLIAGLGWRAIFLVTVPLGVTAMLLVHRHVPVDGACAEPGGWPSTTAGPCCSPSPWAAYTLAMTLGEDTSGRSTRRCWWPPGGCSRSPGPGRARPCGAALVASTPAWPRARSCRPC